MGASEATVMVRKATNSDPWGPSGTDMLKIANLSQRHTEGRQIMDALWLRLTNTGSGKNWRNVYKVGFVFPFHRIYLCVLIDSYLFFRACFFSNIYSKMVLRESVEKSVHKFLILKP
jgi:hypothetical protein